MPKGFEAYVRIPFTAIPRIESLSLRPERWAQHY